MTQLAPQALEAMRVRITRVLPGQILACLDVLTDDQIWWRPNESSNSVGNLILHLCGSINHFLNRALGGFPYERNRPAEFAERRKIARDELRAQFEEMVRKADETLRKLPPNRLTDPSSEPKLNNTVFDDVVGVLTHLSTHTGQIVWITKMLREGGAGNDIWMKAHRDGGAWKRS
jgi:uncharacterized damage-inducible protein DinB